MAGKVKSIKHASPGMLIPQFALFVFILVVLRSLGVQYYLSVSIGLYFLLSLYLKIVIPKWHRKGVFYVRKNEFEGAIYCFNQSYNYFSKRRWLDNNRAYFLFSISKFSYCEMALMNIAFCQNSLGKKKEATATYKRLLAEYPQNPIAQQALGV